jgi:hypothetical protein
MLLCSEYMWNVSKACFHIKINEINEFETKFLIKNL